MARITFKSGKFYASGLFPRLPLLNINHHESYTFKFTASCLYTPINWENDTNKLAGFTLGLFPVKATESMSFPKGDTYGYVFQHHYNSVRLAWRPETTRFYGYSDVPNTSDLTGRIELWLYTYENGVRIQTYLKSVNIDVEYSVSVFVNTHEILLAGDIDFIKQHGFSNVATGYQLHPYFGGDDPAPQEIEYELTRS